MVQEIERTISCTGQIDLPYEINKKTLIGLLKTFGSGLHWVRNIENIQAFFYFSNVWVRDSLIGAHKVCRINCLDETLIWIPKPFVTIEFLIPKLSKQFNFGER